MDYKKPQSTLVQGGAGIYPLTTADQVILADGSRLEKDGRISADSAANSAKLGGKAPEYYIQPRNLLDNSDFRKPVNQRGNSEYTFNFGYSLDRWRLYGGDASSRVRVLSGCIELSLNDNKSYFGQLIDVDKTKTYTFTVLADDGLHVISAIPSVGANDGVISLGANSNGYVDASVVGFLRVYNIYWAALYEGSYTVDTLPPYVPKGYAAELAECQRYFERIGQSGANRGNASMLMAVGNAGEMRVLQGYRVPKRIISPTIMVNGKAVGETVSVRNTMTNEFCTGVLSVWNNTCADRLNALSVAGTSVVGAMYEGYLDIIADL